MASDGPSRSRGDLAIRLALGALVGLGFVPSTVAATLAVGGVPEGYAIAGGVLAGLVAFGWIVRTGEQVR